MYSAFSQRAEAVSLLEVRAGSPPTAPELVWRLHGLANLHSTRNFWSYWEHWFTQVDETHTSLGALVIFRSPRAHQSWIVAAVAVLDGAVLYLSAVKQPEGGGAAVRPGCSLAAFWRVNYDSVLMALAKLTMAQKSSWLSDFTFVPANVATGHTSGRLQKVRKTNSLLTSWGGAGVK